MSKLHGRNEAELAVIVRDEFQAKGLGTELYRQMVAHRQRREAFQGQCRDAWRKPRDALDGAEAGLQGEIGHGGKPRRGGINARLVANPVAHIRRFWPNVGLGRVLL